ncbi:protein of unknown function DUF632 [Macleaya cordata]|uniref:DUF632 domain-containing protein n=1 Tax=Macleaya cordata TaxID=56857 RepID=A0A200QNV9_MACCD|nr:protein of unknown function DUF632 [Macleaya cordata]
MGASSSKIEEDKALQLCRERKRFVRQALDGRCSLAAAHVAYIQSLKSTGVSLRRFIEPEATSESSLYTSTTATPEPLALTDKSLSQFSFSSPSMSQHVDAGETLSLTPSPPNSGRFHANYMKSGGNSSITVEERPPSSVTRTLRSSLSTPPNLTHQAPERSETSPSDAHHLPPEQPPWDYFGLLHPIDNQFSFQDLRGLNHGLDTADDIRRLREAEGIPDLEEDEEKVNVIGRVESEESESEFDEPSTDNLVKSFENRRVTGSYSTSASPTMPSARSIASEEAEVLNGEKSKSPDLTPLRTTSPVVTLPMYEKRTAEKESGSANKHAPKDFFSSLKEIEYLFLKASESGKEVPRMLEANKVQFRPILPGKEGESMASTFFKACFSCGEDPTQVPDHEEPVRTEIKYLTWHRTTSSQSSSSRNLVGSTLKDDLEDISGNLFSSSCMNSGSHVSTLDRLYAWERKLYDEVKASGIIRREYDMKCKLLRQQASRDESPHKIDKTRAVVKDLHSRIRVAIHRIDSISKRIEELRDKELQPQLEELIEGLSRMWEVMFECHRLQFNIISIVYNNGSTKISIQSESHRQGTVDLENELRFLSSSFTKWVTAQKSYVRSIDGWLHKCVSLPQKSSRRKKRVPDPPLRNLGPPIFVTCGVWLDKLEALPMKEVEDSVKVLASDTTRLLPRQEKNQGKSLNHPFSASWKASNTSETGASTPRETVPEDWNSGFDRFQSSLMGFLDRLQCFALSSVKMYLELEKAIQEAKARDKDQSTLNSNS